MTWHYKPFKVITKHCTYYCVKEYYIGCGDDGKEKLWTQDPIAPMGDTKKELIECLELMLKDIKHYRTKVEYIKEDKKRK